MRRLLRMQLPPADGEPCNPLFRMYETVPVRRVVWVVAVTLTARVCPSFHLKNWIYRRLLGMRIGKNTAIALYVMMDALRPELITIGQNCVIGYHTTILTHEYLIAEYRFGEVAIGDEVMIGANVTILAGVTIGSRSVIAAGAVVTQDIPEDVFAAGVPARVIRHRNDHASVDR